MGSIKQVLLLISVAGCVFFANLGGPKLWDEDEPRNAGCAVEMLQRGDWVVPYFNGEVRTHKPVLLYWFMMTAYAAFGINEFSARFWSALLALGTVCLTYGMGVRLLGRQRGLLSGLALGSMLMFVVAARAATPDSVLIFFITASLAVYVWTTAAFGPPLRISKLVSRMLGKTPSDSSSAEIQSAEPTEPSFPTELAAIVLMYGLMGVACLDKGPIGFLLPSAIIGMFMLIQRRTANWRSSDPTESPWKKVLRFTLSIGHPMHFMRTCVVMRLHWLVISVLAVSLPWYVWVTVRSDGEWTRGFFLEHNVGRAVNAMENHDGGVFYYLIAILVGTFPWSVFFIPILIDLYRSLRSKVDVSIEAPSSSSAIEPSAAITATYKNALVFLTCWVLVIVGLFTIASTKLPSYITPCYPAAALLVGNFLYRLSKRQTQLARYWPYASFGCLAIVGVAIAIAIPVAATEFVPNATPLMSIGMMLIASACAAVWIWMRGQAASTVHLLIGNAVVFALLLFGWGAARVSKHQEFEAIAEAIDRQTHDPKIGYAGMIRSSWTFYLGTPITPLGSPNDAEIANFLERGDDHFVIATGSIAERFIDQNPDRFQVVESVPFFLEPGKVIQLLQRIDPPRLAEAETSNTHHK